MWTIPLERVREEVEEKLTPIAKSWEIIVQGPKTFSMYFGQNLSAKFRRQAVIGRYIVDFVYF